MRIPSNLLVCLGLLCVACPVGAQAAIYKCNNDDSIVYQDRPCNGGQAAANLAVIPVHVLEPNSVSPLNLRQEPLPPSQLQSTALALAPGMSDTEVLNLRGWGRPSRITRSKEKHAWREEWTYGSPDEPTQQLQFANGKLASIE